MGVKVGIDVAKQVHWAVALDENGTVLINRKDLLLAMLAAAGIRCLYVSGAVASRARRGTRGGENKTDPRDARAIADQLRIRDDQRELDQHAEHDTALRVLTSRRKDLRQLQTARMNRLRDLLCSIHPGLERAINPEFKADLQLLTRYVTPAELRAAGARRIAAFLTKNGVRGKKPEALAQAAHTAAVEQRIAVPGPGGHRAGRARARGGVARDA